MSLKLKRYMPIVLAAILFGCSDQTNLIKKTEAVNKSYNETVAASEFKKYISELGPSEQIKKEMAKTGRVMQTYVTDSFKNGTKLTIKPWQEDYYIFAQDKKYLVDNDFYIIDLVTFLPKTDDKFAIAAATFAQNKIMNWKNAVDNYDQKKFEVVLKETSSSIIPHSVFYTYAAINNKDTNNVSFLRIEKVKNKGEAVKVSLNDKKSFFIKAPGMSQKEMELTMKEIARDGVFMTDLRVVVSGEELPRIEEYVNKYKNIIKFPLLAKLDCMTKLKESSQINLFVKADISGPEAGIVKKKSELELKQAISSPQIFY